MPNLIERYGFAIAAFTAVAGASAAGFHLRAESAQASSEPVEIIASDLRTPRNYDFDVRSFRASPTILRMDPSQIAQNPIPLDKPVELVLLERDQEAQTWRNSLPQDDSVDIIYQVPNSWALPQLENVTASGAVIPRLTPERTVDKLSKYRKELGQMYALDLVLKHRSIDGEDLWGIIFLDEVDPIDGSTYLNPKPFFVELRVDNVIYQRMSVLPSIPSPNNVPLESTYITQPWLPSSKLPESPLAEAN